eukprot:2595517-Prymnesium_polylepis.1
MAWGSVGRSSEVASAAYDRMDWDPEFGAVCVCGDPPGQGRQVEADHVRHRCRPPLRLLPRVRRLSHTLP